MKIYPPKTTVILGVEDLKPEFFGKKSETSIELSLDMFNIPQYLLDDRNCIIKFTTGIASPKILKMNSPVIDMVAFEEKPSGRV